MQSLRLDAITNEQENAAEAAFESKMIQIQFYKPSAMKEQKMKQAKSLRLDEFSAVFQTTLANTRLPPAPYWIRLPIDGPVKTGR